MKIVWMSDSPSTPSGYGNATRFICSGLANRGHQVSIIGWQTHGSRARWRNCRLYPIRQNAFGADVLLEYLRRLQPDVLVTQGDLWRLTYIANPAISGFLRDARIPWAVYYTIDSDRGNCRLPLSMVHLLRAVDLPIAASCYGRDVGRINGLTPAYIPYGVETKIFRPPKDKVAAKRALGYQDWFVILSDARNQHRKLWPRTLEIFRRFADNKNDVLLHVHCDPNDPAARTNEYYYDLLSDIRFLGLTRKVRFTDSLLMSRGIPLDQLGALYQAADVHLLSSYGEGFGLPTLQAAATGVVPLASDYTASRELVLGHGEAISVRHFVQDQYGMRCALVDIDDAVNKLQRLYWDRSLLETKSKACRRFAEAYDWKRIVSRWHYLLHREVPRLRRAIGQRHNDASLRKKPLRRKAANLITLPKTRRGLSRPVRQIIEKLESIGGHLSAEILRDMSNFDTTFTLPVTLPPTSQKLVRERVAGRIYLASQSDVVVFRKLRRVFPGLTAWSCIDLNRKGARAVQISIIPPNGKEYRSYLAASTLALDLSGVASALPDESATAGVPCIGLAQHKNQIWLWPELSLVIPDVLMAAKLGRWMLTDQGDAAEMCQRAQKRRLRRSPQTEKNRRGGKIAAPRISR
jgi:glycosyltransferase involved in cell wall biosynthesis